MNINEQLIHDFYSAFQKRDYLTMQKSYSDDATFSDPVFENISSDEVKAMWEMFCVRSTDLVIDFKNIVANENIGSAQWKATYTFSLTGNKVINNISAKFVFKNGKIIRHVDSFNFYAWASMALGLKGKLLGWTPFLKHKVQETALKSLQKFIANKDQLNRVVYSS